MIVLYNHLLLYVHNDQKIYDQMKAILFRLISREDYQQIKEKNFLRVGILLENHVLSDNMNKEEQKIMSNIEQFDPNHQNNE